MLIACKSCRRQYDVEGMSPGEHVRCRCDEMVVVPKKEPREARMLHCSGCGGKLRGGAMRCDYCGSEVSLVDRNLGPACPECFARLAAGARFCSDCGVEIHPEAIRTTRAAAGCPRCKGNLVLREFPTGHYTECTVCGGIWLDAGAFDRVVTAKDTTALSSLLPRSAPARPIESAANRVSYVPCPICGHLMHRKNFGGCSGVIVDWCKDHGFWFDAGELEKIIDFINAGGLDRARQMEIDRAKKEIARLEEAKKAIATSGAGWQAAPSIGGSRRDWGREPDWGAALGQVAARLLSLLG